MLERKSIPGQATGEGERMLMCAALLNAKAGLGADKLLQNLQHFWWLV